MRLLVCRDTMVAQNVALSDLYGAQESDRWLRLSRAAPGRCEGEASAPA